jgi:hypothetical protein
MASCCCCESLAISSVLANWVGEHSKLLLGFLINLGHKLRHRVHFRLLVSHGYIPGNRDVPGRDDCESGRGGGCHFNGLLKFFVEESFVWGMNQLIPKVLV